MLATTGGWCAFLSTPDGFDPFFDLYELAKNDTTGVYAAMHAPSTCNPLFTLDEFNAMKGEAHIVQKMASPGFELIIGAKRDPAFGQVLIFGMGGIYAELFNDISVRMVPVNEKSAVKMINEIKGATILKGYRGKPTCDLQAVARCIARISRLLADHPEIVNLDINPLIAYEKGKGCVIVDAKIETSFL